VSGPTLFAGAVAAPRGLACSAEAAAAVVAAFARFAGIAGFAGFAGFAEEVEAALGIVSTNVVAVSPFCRVPGA
jgi:hypothetical protein